MEGEREKERGRETQFHLQWWLLRVFVDGAQSFSLRDRLSSFAAVSRSRYPVNTNVKWFLRNGAKFPGNIVRAGRFALENLLSETSVPFSARDTPRPLVIDFFSHLVSLPSLPPPPFFLHIHLSPSVSISLTLHSHQRVDSLPADSSNTRIDY